MNRVSRTGDLPRSTTRSDPDATLCISEAVSSESILNTLWKLPSIHRRLPETGGALVARAVGVDDVDPSKPTELEDA